MHVTSQYLMAYLCYRAKIIYVLERVYACHWARCSQMYTCLRARIVPVI